MIEKTIRTGHSLADIEPEGRTASIIPIFSNIYTGFTHAILVITGNPIRRTDIPILLEWRSDPIKIDFAFELAKRSASGETLVEYKSVTTKEIQQEL